MPVRDKAVMALVRHQEGGLSFNTIEDVAKIGPLDNRRTISIDEYKARYDDAFEAMVDAIDWNRVLLEASARHAALKDVDGTHQSEWEQYGDEICPECLCEALLAPSYINWATKPTVERKRA